MDEGAERLTLGKRFRLMVRGLSPSVAAISARDALRTGAGAFAGLLVMGLLVFSPTLDPELGLYLIAPFGATAVLVFAVPNSPLAQPWSAVVGNTSSALVGVAVCIAVPDPTLRIALAVGGAIAAMSGLRAMHPPGGAVAMTAAMSPDAIRELGFSFALVPVALGTALLAVAAALFARSAGRHYPFRQFDAAEAPAPERIGLSEEELTAILQRYRQSLNLGVEDLARLIGAAELQAAGRRAAPVTAEAVMSRDLITVSPDTPLEEVADLFVRHGFTSLPVVGPGDVFHGIIFQLHLIRRASSDRRRLRRGFFAALSRLVDHGWATPTLAGDVMEVAVPRATTATPLGALLPILAEGETEAVPILHDGRLAGIVTQTDLIAALARLALQDGSRPRKQ